MAYWIQTIHSSEIAIYHLLSCHGIRFYVKTRSTYPGARNQCYTKSGVIMTLGQDTCRSRSACKPIIPKDTAVLGDQAKVLVTMIEILVATKSGLFKTANYSDGKKRDTSGDDAKIARRRMKMRVE